MLHALLKKHGTSKLKVCYVIMILLTLYFMTPLKYHVFDNITENGAFAPLNGTLLAVFFYFGELKKITPHQHSQFINYSDNMKILYMLNKGQ